MAQYESTHDKFKSTVQVENGNFVLNGKPISNFLEGDLTNINWGVVGAEFIEKSTGIFTILKKVGACLKDRAKRVIIFASSACVGYEP